MKIDKNGLIVPSKLTLEEIKKQLDAGNTVEIECVDADSLLLSSAHQSHRDMNEEMLKSKNLIVTGIYEDGSSKLLSINDDAYRLLSRELQFFRIKRSAPTFSDLIDLAADAIKKKLIVNLYIGPHYIEFDSNGHSHAYDMQEAKRGIDFINSLYTETFVIESESCIKKVKREARGVLSNGNEFKVWRASCGESCMLTIMFDGSRLKNDYDLAILKGATVIQPVEYR